MDHRCGSLPEPYLWWVHQTGTVFVCQSASCELWLWLVRLDWHPDSIRCHLLIQTLRTWFGLPESEFTDYLIAQIWFQIISYFLTSNRISLWISVFGLSIIYCRRKPFKFSAKTQYILTRISCLPTSILFHHYNKHPFTNSRLLTRIIILSTINNSRGPLI